MIKCEHCGIERDDSHPEEHVALCCDCFDLSLGAPLEMINEERSKAGRPPTKAWVRR